MLPPPEPETDFEVKCRINHFFLMTPVFEILSHDFFMLAHSLGLLSDLGWMYQLQVANLKITDLCALPGRLGFRTC